MHRSKLFRALVIGGSMTAATLAGCGEEKSSNPASNQEQNETSSTQSGSDASDTPDASDASDTSDVSDASDASDTPDASDASDASDTPDSSDASDASDTPDSSDASDAQTELAPCFCGSEPSCCEEVEGELQAMEGFECCWGTSC